MTSNGYLFTISAPLDIPAIVYETMDLAPTFSRDDPLYILLKHEEDPVIVRGYGQPLTLEDLSVEIKRPDGGLSWYHGYGGCLMRAFRKDPSSIPGEDAQAEWGLELQKYAEHVGFKNTLWRNADIYVDDRQIIGTSAKNKDGVVVQRACWYEEDPMEYITPLLQKDGINPREFENSIRIVPNLMSYLTQNLNLSEGIFISNASLDKAKLLQQKKKGSLMGACVLG
jgi:hypothetical protein